MSTLSALPGDPERLGQQARRYTNIAAEITLTTQKLRAFSDEIEGAGQAVSELATRTGTASSRLARAQPRYEATAQALTVYAVNLRDAQDSADAAISRSDTARADLPWYEQRKRELGEKIYNDTSYLNPKPLSESESEEATRELIAVMNRIESLQGEISAAQASYDRAVSYRDEAARVAMESIRPALEAMNDSLGDYVDAWVGSLPDFWQGIAQWFGDIFVAIVTKIQNDITELINGAIWVITVISLIPEIMRNLPPELWWAALSNPVVFMPGLLALVAFIAAAVAGEGLTPTPDMRRVENIRQRRAPDAGPRDVYSETLGVNKILDDDGAADSTHVQVVEVLDENGERVGWRVVLPSTQDWQAVNGAFDGNWSPTLEQGAMNDLGSNVALMLTPSQQAAYERAVIQAMMEAGIGPDDPVMLSGWSQGGILAGKMASDPNSPFNIQAIFVSGSPIDLMHIPDSVSVLSVQHPADVVPMLDNPFALPRSGPNWSTIVAAPEIDPITGQPMEQHGSSSYQETASHYLDSPSTPTIEKIKDEQSMFFSDNEVVNVYVGAEGR